MFDKIKNIFKEKDEKKKIENLVAFLIILVVTLILVNKILKDEPETKSNFNQNQVGIELVASQNDNKVFIDNESSSGIEQKLEKILSRINGVRRSRCLNNL